MFLSKIKRSPIMIVAATVFFTFSAMVSLEATAQGIIIKGKICVRDYERNIWKSYSEKLEITLTGDKTGESFQTVSADDDFSFEEVNPEDIIQILWRNDESTEATHVLFPFDQEGSAATLSRGLISFRFRTMDWVLDEFKKRVSTAAIKGRIEEIDEIMASSKQYHEILSKSKNVEQETIDRYKHKIMQHICQKSEEHRQAEHAVFLKLENVSVERRWYVELLNITSDVGYEKVYPAAIVRALNQWVVFARQCYTKHNRWPDRDISFSGEIDESLRNSEIRGLLYKDFILISNILKNSNNNSLRPNPFEKDDILNMNEVSNWIAEINRAVKPLANN